MTGKQLIDLSEWMAYGMLTGAVVAFTLIALGVW